MRLPPISMTSPAGVLIVPFGVVDVCQAGVRRTEAKSSSMVPPMLGSNVWTPSSAISPASSTIATTGAPVRLPMATVSPMWSLWPCVRKIASACTSSAVAAAFGLPVRKGSTSTVLPSCSSAKAECPSQRICISGDLLLVVVVVEQLARQLQPDGHADEHAQPGLLGDQRADRGLSRGRVVLGCGAGDLLLVRLAEPAARGERLVEDALQARRGMRHDLLRVGEPLGVVGQRRDGGVDLLGGEAARGHGLGGA